MKNEEFAAIVELIHGNRFVYRSVVSGEVITFERGRRVNIPYFEDAAALRDLEVAGNKKFSVSLLRTEPSVDEKKEKEYRKQQKLLKVMENDEEVKRVCLIRHGGLGDVLFILPVAAYLSKEGYEVHMQVSDAYSSVVVGQLGVSKIIPEGQVIDRSMYEKVINFDGTIVANQEAEHLHAVDLMFRRAGIDWTALKKKDKKVKLILTDRMRMVQEKLWKKWDLNSYKSVIGINVRSTSVLRNWPIEYINKLVKFLTKKGNAVVLIDRKPVLDIQGKGVISFAGELSVLEMVSVISGCDCLVGPDSGPSHIAGYLGVPFVGVYGPFPALLRLKYYDKVSWIQADVDCGPCFYHKDMLCKHPRVKGVSKCMATIQPVEVIKLVRKMVYQEKGLDIAS